MANILNTNQNTLTTLSNISNYAIGTTVGYNGTYTTSTASNVTLGDNVLKINGNPASLEVKGNVVINGLDLEERLKIIEKVLMIPERDAKMEAKYPSLKTTFDDYIRKLEKYRTFEALKGENNE
jgi:hypothetical protein